MAKNNPGTFRERVTLQRYNGQNNSAGGSTVRWADVDDFWAEVTPLSGTERFEGDQVQAALQYIVKVRYIPALDVPNVAAAYRLLWRNRPLNIRSAPNPDGKREYLDLECELGVAT